MPEIVVPELQQQQDATETVEEKKEQPTSKSVVGIIYPPPEVRNIVDKTADFVARNGPEFEGRIRQNEAGNPKFNFLNQSNPYHAYYQHKIKEIQEGVALEASQPKTAPIAKQQPVVTIVTEPEVPTEPPSEYEFTVDPPAISRRHLDIIKLTARFVARNGPHFMDQLMMREQKNEAFDFLRKNHILFSYFTKMVEQYSKILMPSRTMLQQLQEDAEKSNKILERVDKRVAWEKYQEREKQKAEAAAEKERVEYAQIDWHDFVICETINFREDETGYLPPPIQPNQLANRLLQQNKFDKIQDEVGEVEDVEMEVEEGEPEQKGSEEMDTAPIPPPLVPSLSNTSSNLQIRKDYDPKARNPPSSTSITSTTPASGGQQQFLVSPITGERVPADKLEEHMKHALLDRRWAEEKKRQIEERQNEDVVFAEGNQIAENIGKIAKKRTDIFGREETMIGLEIGEENKKAMPTVQWDGHSGSADMARQQAQSKVTVRDQLEHIQRVQGLLSDPKLERIGPKVSTSFQQAPPLPPPSSHIPPRPPPQPQPLVPTPQPPPPPRPTPLVSAPQPVPLGGPPRPTPLVPPQNPQMQMGPPRPLLPTPHGGAGLMPNIPPPHGPPGMMPPPPLGGNIHPAPHVEPPPAKRNRTEDNLIPEKDFIANNPGPVTFKVQVPNMPDRAEWSLNGQFLTFTLPISDPVSVIKAKINDELGMPAGKQKLQIAVTFIKDSNSLGYYNFTPNTVVQLGLKERGGKKR